MQEFNKNMADLMLERNMGCSSGLVCMVFLCVVMMALLCGCKTQYVPVEKVVKEYIHTTDTVREKDTIRNDKETIIREMSAADSAMLAKLGLDVKENQHIILVLQKELERQSHEKQETRTDTIFRDKEVQVPYPVERKLTKWETFCIDYGKVTLGGTVLALIAAVVALVMWIRKKSIRKKSII